MSRPGRSRSSNFNNDDDENSMKVISFIKQKGLDALKTELGIRIRKYDDDNKSIVVLDYCQIKSPKTHPIVRECRGLILDTKDWSVLARPFTRFYNWGEALNTTQNIDDFSELIAYEKMDGSLVKFWFDSSGSNLWQCGSRGTAFAEGICGGHGITFRGLIYRALKVRDDEHFDSICRDNLDPAITYLFELTSFENRVVVRYEGDAKLWYLGAINRETGDDLSCNSSIKEAVTNLGAKSIGQWSFTNIDDCLMTAAQLPNLAEGYVLYNPRTHDRIKVKNPAYVAAHHRKGKSLNPKKMKELVLTNEVDEYLTYFPEDKEHFKKLFDMLKELESEILQSYITHNHLNSKIQFASAVKDYCYAIVLFRARATNVNPIEVWSKLDQIARYRIFSKFIDRNDKTDENLDQRN